DARLEFRRLRGTDARRARQTRKWLAEQARQPAMPPEQTARDVERGRGRGSRAEHDGEELGVGERCRALRKQALARAFTGRPLADGRHSRTIMNSAAWRE